MKVFYLLLFWEYKRSDHMIGLNPNFQKIVKISYGPIRDKETKIIHFSKQRDNPVWPIFTPKTNMTGDKYHGYEKNWER